MKDDFINGDSHTPNKDNIQKSLVDIADQYLIVGTKYYKKILVPNKKMGTPQLEYKKWTKERIKSDHGKGVFLFIKSYDTFAIFPDFKNYQERIYTKWKNLTSTAFNLCKPLPFDPIEGDFPLIKSFINHIASNSQSNWNDQKIGDPLTMLIDSYRLKFQNPIQLLPAVCLVGKSQATGKSSIMQFNADLFGSNATVIGMKELTADFNTPYADKLVIGLDESFVKADNRKVKEEIKKLITDEKIFYHPKGVDPHPIDFYGWMWFSSNNEYDFMKMEESDKRFWIIKVYTLKEQDPDIRLKMKKEIPAFIHYCLNTKVIHPKVSRIWFDENLIITDQMKTIIKHTRDRLSRAIIDFAQDVFKDYEVQEFNIPAKQLTELINENTRYKFDKSKIMDWLTINKGMKPAKRTKHYKFPSGHKDDFSLIYTSGKGRPYTFKVDDWFEPEEIDKIGKL